MEIASSVIKNACNFKTVPLLGNLSSVQKLRSPKRNSQNTSSSSRHSSSHPGCNNKFDRSGKLAFGTVASNPNVPQQGHRFGGGGGELPLYLRAAEFRNRIAVCDTNGSFLYDDIFRRSADLAEGISDLFKSSAPHRQHKIGFLCPNGASYVITQWACWMSGNIAVPLSKDDKENSLEFCINDAGCDLVIASKDSIDKINDICKGSDKKVVCLDDTWTANPKKEVNGAAESLKTEFISGLHRIHDPSALILFNSDRTFGRKKKVEFSHAQLNAQMDSIAQGWDLTEKCSVLHALPLTNLYGIVSALMAPLSVGGKVVMLPQFDTLKVWSHLLGLSVNTPQPLPKVNLFLSVPSQYQKLLERHKQLFRDRKTKEYVKANCKKRLRAMTSSFDPLAKATREEWAEATGHNIVNCYTSSHGGTVLSGAIENGAENRRSENQMEALPGVEARIVRFNDDARGMTEVLGQSGVGELYLKGPGVGKVQPMMKMRGEWASTGDTAKIANGRVELL